MFGARQKLDARLDGRKVRVIRHHRFGEGGELHAFLAEFVDLLRDLGDGCFTAIEHRAELDSGGFDDFHDKLLEEGGGGTTRWSILHMQHRPKNFRPYAAAICARYS